MQENEIREAIIEYISDGDIESIEDAIDEYAYEILGDYSDCVVETLGMGGLGFALLCRDEKNVVKLTLDKTEYNFARNVNKFTNYDSVFVKVYNVIKLAEVNNQILSLIHKEYAVALSKSEQNLFEIFHELNHIGNEMHDKLDYYFGITARKQYGGLGVMDYYEITELEKQKIDYRKIFDMINEGKYPEIEIDRIVYNSMRTYINWFNSKNIERINNQKVLNFANKIHNLAKNDGIFFYDFKPANIGKKNDKNGEYCIFDFGHIIF